MTPQELRMMIRKGKFTGPTAGQCPGYAQANLVVLPKEQAFDFLLYCTRNRMACPLLEVTEPGCREPVIMGKGADIASDLPRYRVYENGVFTRELTDVRDIWRDDLVCFLIGCSFSFEEALLAAGIPVRHIEEGRNVPMYDTSIPCRPAGIFKGNMVVSMRPMTPRQAVRASVITGRMPFVHGAPVHIGDPAAIGIKDISRPDYGDPVTVCEGEVPVFWPCGVTPQNALMASKPAFAITHAPGHMFVCDVKNTDLEG